MKKEIKTYHDLKEFINSLDQSQLDHPVLIWNDNEQPEQNITGALELSESYTNVGYGFEPKSHYFNDKDISDDIKKEAKETTTHSKYQPILFV